MVKLINLRMSALRVCSIALKVARATRLTKPLRHLIGPIVGNLIARLSNSSNHPLIVNGHEMVLSAPGSYPPVAMATGEYEKQTTYLFEKILHPSMIVVDVGAHVGYFSLLAARNVGPEGKVFSFEPDPTNYELLLRNVNLNGYTNITPVNSAISDSTGLRTLFQTSLDSGRHSTYRHGLPHSGSVKVKTWTLDDFLETQNWPNVDLVKMDVEGAEVDVLNGMSVLREKMPGIQLIVEFNPALLKNAGVESFAFLEKLMSMEFRIACINEQQGIIPWEDLIITNMVATLLRDGSSVNLHCSPT